MRQQSTTKMIEASDRRGAHRAPLGIQVSWTLDNRKWYDESSRDISSTGIMLRTRKKVPIGTSIQLRFKLPNLKFQEPIIVTAETVQVVQRRGRQIGIGCRFKSFKSQSCQVIHAFVCRILELPMEDGMEGLGTHNESGYVFKMDRLAREADIRKIRAKEKKLAEETAKRKKEAIKIWARRGLKIGLIFLAFLVLVKIGILALNFLSSLKNTLQ